MSKKLGVHLVSHGDFKDWSQEITNEINQYFSEDDVWSLVNSIGDKALEYTPRDTGELQESQYRTVERSQQGYVGEVGYTAPHAVFVHEIPADHSRGNNPPMARDKFLEAAGREMLASWSKK